MNSELLIIFFRMVLGDTLAYTSALFFGFALLMVMMTLAVKTFMNRSL